MNRDRKKNAERKGRRRAGGIWGLACIVSLSGCSLAVPGAGAEAGEDRLIGVFITAEYLDLYDMESYLKDHGNLLTGGGEVTLSHDPEYEGRLYAQIDPSKGPEDGEIFFGDVRGEYMLYPEKTDEREPYRVCLCTDGICEINTNTNIADDQEEYSIDGTMYMLPGQMEEDVSYHANPVYQTAEGEIYAVSGQGFSTSGDGAEGEVFSTTLSGEVTMREKEKTKTEKSSVTLRYAVMNRPEQTTLYQMNQAHQIVRKDTYEPGKVPETIAVERETEYVLAETEKENRSGEKTVSREIVGYNPNEETFLETFYVLDSDVVAKRESRVVWDRNAV